LKKWFAALENTALKNSKTIPAAKIPEAPRFGFFQGWTRFWFSPVQPLGMHALRLLTGVLLIFWLFTFLGNQTSFFGLGGWVDRESASRLTRAFLDPEGRDMEAAANFPEAFRSGWSILYLFGSSPAWVNAVYWGSMILFLLFAMGLWTRITSVLTWLVVGSFIANPVTRLEAEPLLVVLAFYLMIGYLLQGQWNRDVSWPERILGLGYRVSGMGWRYATADTHSPIPDTRDPTPSPSVAANLAIRLLQVHFAIIIVISGLHKLQVGDWWSGVAFWYPLHPPYETTAASLETESLHASREFFFLSLAQYALLAWQLGFPLFAWRRSWRWLLLGGVIVGWIGCLAIYKQPLFGPIYCIAALSYLTPDEWLWISDKVRNAASWIRGREAVTAVKHPSRA
jgi:hypothetical protein